MAWVERAFYASLRAPRGRAEGVDGRVKPGHDEGGYGEGRRRRAGVAAGLVLAVLLAVSLSAGLIANDRPLVLDYRGHLYFPIFEDLPGTEFGPQFLPTLADYRNPETVAAIKARGWMIWPLIPYRYDSIVWNAAAAPAPPSWRNWLGTDAASRDVLARLIYGLRTSLLFGVCLTAAAAAIGVIAGAVQGYYGGATDLLFQRFTEIWSGIPQLFLLLILASILAPNVLVLLVFLLLFSWMPLAGRVRAEFLRARDLDYVLAAKVLGVPDWRIMLRHILPNAMVAVLTFLPFLLAESITLLASLDFLGFGLPPGSASLGEMLAEAKDNPQAPWLGVAVCVTLGGTLFLLVLIGEAVRDALNPSRER